MSLVRYLVGRTNVDFDREFMSINDVQVNYHEIEEFSHLLTITKQSANLIPTTTTSSFVIKIKSNNRTFKIHESKTNAFRFETEARKDVHDLFAKLSYAISTLIQPHIVERVLNKIQQDGFVKIAGLKITPAGIEKSRLFRTPEILLFDEYFNSALQAGKFFVYKNVNDKPKIFFTCSMSEMNSAAVPEVLLCLLKYHIAQKQGA